MPGEHRVGVDPNRSVKRRMTLSSRIGKVCSNSVPIGWIEAVRPRRSAFGVAASIRARASAGRRPAGGAFDRNSKLGPRKRVTKKC